MKPRDPVRVLIVDDSALMRKLLSDLLGQNPAIQVVGTARNADELLQLAPVLKPDVVTLDVEMPGMSGLDAIPALLALYEVPIVMVSAFTQEGAEVTLIALERGAVDFVPKPDRNQLAHLRSARELLAAKVLNAAQSRVKKPRPGSLDRPLPHLTPTRSGTLPPHAPSTTFQSCVVLGISTGGPQTLTHVLSALKLPAPPILIVQHMPGQFTGVLAQRLDRLCPAEVKEAAEGDLVLPDRVLIAHGSKHLRVVGRPQQARAALDESPPVQGHRPSVDVLFRSAVTVYGAATIGVIMTGMGRDGVEGCKLIRAAGGTVYGQDESSSIVYGMNKIAYEEGAVDRQFSTDQLVSLIAELR